MDARRACQSTQVEIDESILGYLLYRTTHALLRDRRNVKRHGACPSQADPLLHLVDQFLMIFHGLHPQHQVSGSLKFRLRLLKFTTVFTRRLQETQTSLSPVNLQDARREAQARTVIGSKELKAAIGQNWESLCAHGFLSDVACKSNRDQFLKQVGYAPAMSNHYGTEFSFSLLDSLPGFMALSAAQNALQESTITVVWMELAARYMAQSVLEQYLMYGATFSNALQQAFGWGFDPNLNLEEGSDGYETNAMFYGDEQDIVAWRNIKYEHVRALLPPENTSLEHHLVGMTSHELSPVEFDGCMLDFLEGLLNGQSKPLLVQLELEEIEGLSTLAIRRSKEGAGITVS